MRKIKNNNLSLYKLTNDKIIILGKNSNLQLQAKLFVNDVWSNWINFKKTIKGTPLLCIVNDSTAFIFILTLSDFLYYSTLTISNDNISLDNNWKLLKYDQENMPTFTTTCTKSPDKICMFTVNEFNETCYKVLPFNSEYILDFNYSPWINIEAPL